MRWGDKVFKPCARHQSIPGQYPDFYCAECTITAVIKLCEELDRRFPLPEED